MDTESQEKPQPKQAPKPQPGPPPAAVVNSLTPEETQLRHHFAAVALAEIVRWQVAEGKGGQEDVAASWAYRYADRMLTQSRKPFRNVAVMMNRGQIGVMEEPIAEVQ